MLVGKPLVQVSASELSGIDQARPLILNAEREANYTRKPHERLTDGRTDSLT